MLKVASISGGKDSVAMCLRLVEEGVRVDDFVFADTGMEYPECYDALARFEKLTGRKITRLRNSNANFEFLLCDKPLKPRRDGKKRIRETGYWWPSMLNRWCTKQLKTRVIESYYKKLGQHIDLIGIAADEQRRISADANKQYPLVKWGMTEADCLQYCRQRGFYKSPCAYDYCRRMSCYVCPLQNLQQVRYIVQRRPELWAEIKRLENKLGMPWKKNGTDYYEHKYRYEQCSLL